uniref:Uncharacterized protein n=1 Tax=Oncorhynchus mykiss TaxID=8022 RepID=A0A8K9UNY2_ONCMY
MSRLISLQPHQQHRHPSDQVCPRQVQHCPGPSPGGELQPSAGLHGDRVPGHQGIHHPKS